LACPPDFTQTKDIQFVFIHLSQHLAHPSTLEQCPDVPCADLTKLFGGEDANTQANEIRKGEYYAPFMHISTLTIVE